MQRNGTPGTYQKDGSALTGRKRTWIAPNRRLVKTNSKVCCCHASSCAPVWRVAGGVQVPGVALRCIRRRAIFLERAFGAYEEAKAFA